MTNEQLLIAIGTLVVALQTWIIREIYDLKAKMAVLKARLGIEDSDTR